MFGRVSTRIAQAPRSVVIPRYAGLLASTLPHRSLATRSDVDLPDNVRAVVVGGGIIGTSIAYHLARQPGWEGSDILLLERDGLTSGTTWHAAGLCVTFGSLSETSTRLRQYSQYLYRDVLEEETGQNTGFLDCGFIELATHPDRLEEYRRVAAFNRHMGVDVEEIGPQDVKELFPLCNVDDVLAGYYVKGDGRVNPVDVTMAMAKGARMKGVRLVENCPVTGVTQVDAKVTGVTTESGKTIGAEFVVNAAGMWARQLGELSGVAVPNQAAEHYYLVTDSMPEVDPSWPVIEDPSSYTYIRPEGGGLMVGLFESTAAAWNVKQVPDDFSFGEIEPDWERMTPFLEQAMKRVPLSLETGMKKFFCGPESFTPDLAPIIGEAPELRNYFVAAGLNSIGILTGGGIGRLLAHWIAHGKPDMDVTGMNIDRLQKYQANPEYRSQRVVESLGLVYKCHYPNYSTQTARNVKNTPFRSRLEAKGAYFRDVSGWESADWYAPDGVEPKQTELTFGRANWFPYWQAEHTACREGVIVMDMSFMSKFQVVGRDAGKHLNYICTANVDAEDGFINYTQVLDDDGKMQGDITVIKHTADKFTVIATDTAHRHIETWLRRYIPKDAHAHVQDVTGGFAQLNVQGPHSRELMQALTDTDMSDEAFPFRRAAEIGIGHARVLCVRITYLGELGYELHIPTEFAGHVYDRVVEIGEANYDLKHAGLKALASLRLEKGYRDYGHDMDNTDTLLECGLGFTCDFDKPGGFRGMEKVLEAKAKKLINLPQRLVSILCKDPEPLLYHGEVVWRNGKRVGDVRAGSYAHTLGGSIGLAMIKADEGVPFNKKWIDEGRWELEINGRMYPATISLKPMYDPTNEKIKG